MKSRCLQWVGHLARIEETRDAYKIFMRNSLVSWPLRRMRGDERMALRWNLRPCLVKMGSGCMWLRSKSGGRFDISGSADMVSRYQFFSVFSSF
jgi:hypothetical protein